MAYAESPRVGCAALDRLKVLILEASGTAAGAVLEARPHSLALEGEADATFKPTLIIFYSPICFDRTPRNWSGANCPRRRAGKRRA